MYIYIHMCINKYTYMYIYILIGDLIAEWGSDTLQKMIRLSSFLEITENSANPCNSLKSNIFQAFLALRSTPTLTESRISKNSMKVIFLYFFILFWLLIVGLFCYICIIYMVTLLCLWLVCILV
jgi:hypothetical protein